MVTVKLLKMEEAFSLSPVLKTMIKNQSGTKIYLREAETCAIEADFDYFLIDSNGHKTPLTIPPHFSTHWKNPNFISELEIPENHYVIGFRDFYGKEVYQLILHSLPAILPVFNKQGKYRTRAGQIVTVDTVKPNITYSLSGYVPNSRPKKPPVWTHWTRLGEIIAGAESCGTDLVELVEEL